MLQNVIDFIFLLLKSLVLIAIVTVIVFLAIAILSILMPDNAAKALELFKDLIGN